MFITFKFEYKRVNINCRVESSHQLNRMFELVHNFLGVKEKINRVKKEKSLPPFFIFITFH